MARPRSGVDSSLLLPIGVMMVAALIVATPLAFRVASGVTSALSDTVSLFWAVPFIVVAALFLTSSEMLVPTFNHYDRSSYRNSYYGGYDNRYGVAGPSWGLLGLMLLLLLLLPWQY